MNLNLSITRNGAYLRGVMLVAQAVALPLLVKGASGAPVTNADVMPAIIAGFTTGWAYINQLHATTARDKQIIVWLAGFWFVGMAFFGSLQKQLVSGAHINSAHIAMACLEAGNALFAYLNKSLSIAKAQDEWDKKANLADPKPSMKEQAVTLIRDKAQGILDATGGTSAPAPTVPQAEVGNV